MIWRFLKSIAFMCLTALGFNNLAERIGVSYIQNAINHPDDSSEGGSNGMICGRAVLKPNLKTTDLNDDKKYSYSKSSFDSTPFSEEKLRNTQKKS